MKFAISSIIALGVLFLVVQFYRGTYSPPEVNPLPNIQGSQVTTRKLIPVTCAIVISNPQRQMGEELTGLSIGASSGMKLVRPVGEILSTSLLKAGQQMFKTVKLVASLQEAESSDLIIRLNTWSFGKETGYDFKGLPMLIGFGNAYATLSIDVEVSGRNITQFQVKESAKGTLNSSLMLFPGPRITRTMTEATDLAAAIVSDKIMERISGGISSTPARKTINRYIDNKNGTITDTKTNLIWTKKDSHSDRGKCMSWNDSELYVNELTTGGYTDWRLPTVNELMTILEESKSNISYRGGRILLDPIFTGKAATTYWSSEKFICCVARNVSFREGSHLFNRDGIELSFICDGNDKGVRAVRSVLEKPIKGK